MFEIIVEVCFTSLFSMRLDKSPYLTALAVFETFFRNFFSFICSFLSFLYLMKYKTDKRKNTITDNKAYLKNNFSLHAILFLIILVSF